MKDLVVRLASMYRAADVTVQGGGTAAGVQALADNAADIADASSEIDEEPWAQIERRRHGHVLQTAIGYDVVVIYVNSAHPVKQLSLRQLKGVVGGSIRNWSDREGRARQSMYTGRRAFLGLRAIWVTLRSSHIDSAPGRARPVAIQTSRGGPATMFSDAAVLDGTYPLAGAVYFYTLDTAAVPVWSFISWAVSPAAKGAFTQAGYTQMPQ
jgi:ABC-type phosphate transport system substrate-binding protein